MNTSDGLWRPLGSLLVEKGVVSESELESALAEQERSGRRLGEIMLERGVVSVPVLTTLLLEQCGVDVTTERGFGSGLRAELERRSIGEFPRPAENGDEPDGAADVSSDTTDDDEREESAVEDAAEPAVDETVEVEVAEAEPSTEDAADADVDVEAEEHAPEPAANGQPDPSPRRRWRKRRRRREEQQRLEAALVQFDACTQALQDSLAEMRTLLRELSKSDLPRYDGRVPPARQF